MSCRSRRLNKKKSGSDSRGNQVVRPIPNARFEGHHRPGESHFVGLDKREDRRSPKPWGRLHNEYRAPSPPLGWKADTPVFHDEPQRERPCNEYCMPLPPLGWKADTPPFHNEPQHVEGSGKHCCSGSDLRCPQRPRTPLLHVLSSPRQYSEHKSHSHSPRSDKHKDRAKSWSMSGSSVGSRSLSPKCQVGRHSSEHCELEYREGHNRLTPPCSISTIEPLVELTYCGVSPPTGKTSKIDDELELDLPVMLKTPLGPLAFTPEALKLWGCAHLNNSE